MKIGIKPYARSRRKELTDATGRKDRTLEARPDAGPVARQTGDRMRGPDAGGNRPDAGHQRPIEYREVPGARNCDRTLTASDRWFAAATVGTTGRVRSGRFSVRSVAELREFNPSGYFLSGAYKYNPQPAI